MTKRAQGGGATRRSVKILVVAVSVLFALALAEVVLRVAGYSYPVFYTTDAARGYALKPGMEGWYRKEGESYVRINSDGLRDREHALEKPPNTLRVAVVGDSYAEALQVEQEAAFWSVAERLLRECPALAGREVEFINFGVSGYGTAQELITLRERVWTYAPDVVLLAFTTNNDITDNSRALKRTDEIPYFVRRDGRLVLDDSFKETSAFRLRDSALNRAAKWVRDRSRVIQLGHQAHGAIKTFIASRHAAPSTNAATAGGTTNDSNSAHDAARGASDNANGTTNNANGASVNANGGGAAALEEVGIDNLIYREPKDAIWEEAWAVTEDLLKTMRAETEARGARFLVVTTSNAVQVVPDPALREQFMRRVGSADLFYPDRRVKSLGEREGFRVLNLAPALRDYADEHRVFLHGFGPSVGRNGHWNADGHRVAGQLVAQELCAMLSN
ncbi:MAG TPA: SGNH/GDSL hydrolase family protein [Pyrinomonadaceae bacterium]|nr:SGNH/GDSL hydrolase family protein [Pyrinomonadaceae bacterium]